MRYEEHARSAAEFVGEGLRIESCQVGFAQAGRQHRERPPSAFRAARGERLQRFGLHASRLGSLVLGFDFAARKLPRGGACSARVLVEPLVVQGARRGPLVFERMHDLGVRSGIPVAFDAEIPLDAVGQRGAGPVRRADPCDVVATAFETPGLRMERSPERRRFDYTDLEVADARVSQRYASERPVEQCSECVRLGDVEVVAGQHPERGAAPQCLLQLRGEQSHAGVLHERCDDRHAPCVTQRGANVPDEPIRPAGRERLVAPHTRRARDEALRLVVSALGNHESDAATRVVDITVEARDDVDVQVHDRLAGCFAGIETDVVAVGPGFVGVEFRLDDLDQVENRELLLARGLEPGRNDALRNHQRMAWGHRKTVAYRERELVLGDAALRVQLEENTHARAPSFGPTSASMD